MVANKHWHWWDIFHTGGPAGRRTDHSIRSAFFSQARSIPYVPLPQLPTAQTIPHSSQHTYASITELRRSAATEGFFLLGTNLTLSSRDPHGRQGDQDRRRSWTDTGVRYCAQSICQTVLRRALFVPRAHVHRT